MSKIGLGPDLTETMSFPKQPSGKTKKIDEDCPIFLRYHILAGYYSSSALWYITKSLKSRCQYAGDGGVMPKTECAFVKRWAQDINNSASNAQGLMLLVLTDCHDKTIITRQRLALQATC